MVNGEDTHVSAREQVELIRRVLFKRWWMVVLVAMVSGLSAFGTSKLLDPVYEATTTVRILKEPSLAEAATARTWGQGRSLQAEAMWFTSRQVVEPAIRRLALDERAAASVVDLGVKRAQNLARRLLGRPPADENRFTAVLQRLRGKAIKVKELRGSSVLEIKVSWDDPEMTMRIANTLVDVFIEQFQTFNRARTRQNRIYLEEQVRLTETRLEEAEGALVTFQKETGLVGLDERQLGVRDDVKRLMIEKGQVELTLAAAKAERDSIDERLNEIATGDENPNEALRAALANPQSMLRTLMSQAVSAEVSMSPTGGTYTQKHPAGTHMELQLEAVQTRLREELEILSADPEISPDDLLLMVQEEEKRAGVGERIETQLQTGRDNLDARITVYAEQLREAEARLAEAEQDTATLPDDLQRYIELSREKRVNEELYTMLSTRLAGARVDENSDMYDVRVFDPAQMPIKPLKPKPFLMTVVGAFMGCLLGMSLAFAIEYMDDSFRSVEEVESYLDLPVLAELPKVKVPKRLPAPTEVPRIA